MNTNSLLIAVFKPTLKKKFNFKEIEKVIFKANKITDTLNLSAWGTSKENFNLHLVELNTLKLSENSEFTDLFLNKIKDKANFKEVKAAEIEINFKTKIVETVVYYVNFNDEKCKKTIQLNF